MSTDQVNPDDASSGAVGNRSVFGPRMRFGSARLAPSGSQSAGRRGFAGGSIPWPGGVRRVGSTGNTSSSRETGRRDPGHRSPSRTGAARVSSVPEGALPEGSIPGAAGRRGLGRRGARFQLIPLAVGALLVLGLLALLVANIGTEAMWYQALGFGSVFATLWLWRAVLFLAGFLLLGGTVLGSFLVAYREHRWLELTEPIPDPANLAAGRETPTPETEPPTATRVRLALDPMRRSLLILAPLVLGLVGGFALSSNWRTVLLALNGVPFGISDPQFGLDIGYYVFLLPFFRFGLDFVRVCVVVAAVAAVLFHSLFDAIHLGWVPDGIPRISPTARKHLAILAALFLLTLVGDFWLGRYELLGATGDKFDGASYAAIHAVLPGRTILTIIALVVTAVVLVCLIRQQDKLAGIAVCLLVLSTLILNSIYPALMQRFQVNPNAQAFEEPYIQRNIDATQAAFGLGNADLEIFQYAAKTTADPLALRQDAETTASIRLLDPAIVPPSFRQLQQNKQYYDFPNHLSVDRYTIGGVSRDTVIAARELNLAGLGAAQRNWINDHTVFTHGYGVVAAYGNQAGIDGRPAFFEGGIPTSGQLTDSQAYEPRIYFSPSLVEYSVVGTPAGMAPWELDYQTDDTLGGVQVRNTFPTLDVTGGPSIGTFWRQALFALRFGDEQLLFSDRVTAVSQILFHRDPANRVAKVAPWLILDDRVYPAVVDGRVKWIIDGYTATDSYPYAQTVELDYGVERSYPLNGNYLRNSVKATVDAYDGSVTLYAWEPSDPILQAWRNIFPNTVQPMSEISADLMSHLRYPEDLFEVQRSLLTRYHVQDADAFFSGQDFWRIPEDPTFSGDAERPLLPPYYLTLKMPGQAESAFSLTSVFVPGGNSDREILTGFLAADAEAGSVAGVRASDYGKLRLLVMPRDVTVPGPGQVQTNFVTNPAISQQLNVLEIGSSEVIRGNQLTLPVGGGLLYVQPIYVQSAEGTQFPLLRKVLVAFGDSVGFADTLTDALDQVFGDAVIAPPANQPLPANQPPPGSATSPELTDELAAALADAEAALADSAAALQAGDFAAYGNAQARLRDAVERAIAAYGYQDQATTD